MAGSKTKRNFIYNIGYQILSVCLPLISAPYVSRVLGAYNLGVYNYTYSIADYFILLAMLGVKNYGNRQIAMVRDDKKKLSKTFCSIYALQLLSSFVMIVLYFLYICTFAHENRRVSIAQSLYLMTAVVDISWFFFGMEEFKITVTRNAIIKVASLICIFIFVKRRDDLLLYTLILAGSMLAGYISIFPFLKKYVKVIKPTLSEIKQHIKPNLLLFIPVIAVSIFNVMDKIMLGWISSYEQVGLYGNTEKLMRIPLGIITALGTVMMPHMSHMVATGDIERSKKVIEQSMIFIMCMGCALAGGLAGVGHVFAPIFFGEEFVACGTLIMFLSPTVLSLSWANVIRMQYLIPNKMDTEFTISTIIGAVVNIIANMLLIPKYGALGAIWGTLCAETSLTFYQTWVVRKYLPIRRYLSETIPFLIIGIFMCVVVVMMGNHLNGGFGTLVIQILSGVVIYVSLILIYIFTNKKEGIIQFKSMLTSYLETLTEKLVGKTKR